jgi:hypothetical protein
MTSLFPFTTSIQDELITSTARLPFAYHFWQRARQNCVNIEMLAPENRIESGITPLVGLRVISLYGCARTVLVCLLAFNLS